MPSHGLHRSSSRSVCPACRSSSLTPPFFPPPNSSTALHRRPPPTHTMQYVESLREILYDLESSAADAPGPDVLAAYKQHVAWFGRELRPAEVCVCVCVIEGCCCRSYSSMILQQHAAVSGLPVSSNQQPAAAPNPNPNPHPGPRLLPARCCRRQVP